MNRGFSYSLLFILFFQGVFWSQTPSSIYDRLKQIDKNTNDSLALQQLELLKQKKTGDAKTKLEIDARIIMRCNHLRNYSRAIAMGNEGLLLARKSGIDTMEAFFNKLLGMSNYYMDRRRLAADYFKKALVIAEKNNYWELEASCNNNIGGSLADVQEYKLAEPYLLRSIAIMKEHGLDNSPVVLRTYRVLARLYSEDKREDKAEILYLKLIEISKATKDTSLLCDNLLFYSDLLARRKEFGKALEMSEQALEYRRKAKDLHDLQWALTLHSNNLFMAGRYEEAYKAIREQGLLQRKVFAKDLEKEISEVEVKYKTAQIQYEKELAELKAKKQKQIYLFAFLGLILLGASGIFIWNQRRNARLNMQFQKQKLETLIEGEEKERIRVAKDLHDGIVQDLTALKLNLAAKNYNQLESDIDRAINEVRGISYQMMPKTLEKYGLIPAIKDLLQKTLAKKGIEVEFEAIDPQAENAQLDPQERFPEKIEVCLYRVCQELTNNILKHSGATIASFHISKHKASLSLVCEDNGKGFNEDTLQKGLGMNSIISRVEILKGTISFQSPDNEGTVVVVSIPLS